MVNKEYEYEYEYSNCRILAQDSWDTYERNDFSKPRLLHLPIQRKVLNSLTWDIWLSLINNNLLVFRLPVLCCKLLYKLTPPPHLLPQRLPSSFKVTWNAVCQVWSSNNSHQIKRNCPLLSCDYFKWTYKRRDTHWGRKGLGSCLSWQPQHRLEKNFQTQSTIARSEFIKNKEQR